MSEFITVFTLYSDFASKNEAVSYQNEIRTEFPVLETWVNNSPNGFKIWVRFYESREFAVQHVKLVRNKMRELAFIRK